MPRSGKERKARRRERRRAAQPEAAIPSDRSDGALGDRGLNPGTDSSDDEQRFPMRMLTESSDGENLSIRDLLVRSVGEGLRSKNPRIRNIAAKNALQMEKMNQRDEEFAEDLKIKRAVLEQRGGHVGDEAIPTGVVLLSRPDTSVDEWQAGVEADLAMQAAADAAAKETEEA